MNAVTVTQLNTQIKNLVDSQPDLADVAVMGELSNYKIYPSGHHYFTLKDAESSLRCVMFRTSASKLRFKPESGMKVTAAGRISVYSRDGAYQLYCTNLMPEGVGDLQVAFEQLKEKLRSEGLFDRQYKKPLPRFPRRIAVITSSAGAAVRDIIRVLGKRWPMSQVVILPVRVQGVEAPAEIVGALRYANKYDVGDLIITGRGGGSIEDLWAFNDERVARAIFESRIPVISAVGHEPDVTISDYVADVRAATPSNAAELAVPDEADIRKELEHIDARSGQAMRKKLSELSTRLKDLKSRRVLESPTAVIDQKRMELDLTVSKMAHASEKLVSARRVGFVRLAEKLDALSPLKVLGRGYSIAEDTEGNIIYSVKQTKSGDSLKLRLSDGLLRCSVDGIEER